MHVTDATFTPENDRKSWRSVAYWLLLIVWTAAFGLIGFTFYDPKAISQVAGAPSRDVIVWLAILAGVVGLAALGIGRSR